MGYAITTNNCPILRIKLPLILSLRTDPLPTTLVHIDDW